MDFSRFDKEIDKAQLEKDYKEAKENGGLDGFDEAPKGKYTVKIESMEIKPTKSDGSPMFSVQCRVVEAIDDDDNEKAIEYVSRFKKKKPCLFFNRKIYGNKVSDNWNDGRAIATVTGWLAKLELETDTEFTTYSEFAEAILDAMEEVEEYGLLMDIEYDPNAFNPIKIVDVYEE